VSSPIARPRVSSIDSSSRSFERWRRTLRVSRPCTVLAAAILARPSGVLGPVDSPPCVRHTDRPRVAGARQRCFVRFDRAVHCGQVTLPPAVVSMMGSNWIRRLDHSRLRIILNTFCPGGQPTSVVGRPVSRVPARIGLWIFVLFGLPSQNVTPAGTTHESRRDRGVQAPRNSLIYIGKMRSFRSDLRHRTTARKLLISLRKIWNCHSATPHHIASWLQPVHPELAHPGDECAAPRRWAAGERFARHQASCRSQRGQPFRKPSGYGPYLHDRASLAC
jgi:hypothetical protein